MGQKLPQRPLGSQGLQASAQGLGIMSFVNTYNDESHTPNERENQTILARAAELGATFIDTADMYGSGFVEEQLGVVLKKNRSHYTVATKFGLTYEEGSKAPLGNYGIDGRPDYLQRAYKRSLERLQTDNIDLYYQHSVDRDVPLEDTWRELKKLVERGHVKYLGISEATPDEIRRAHAIHPVTAVQLEWSLFVRDAEKDLVPLCRELGIGIVCYCPLGRGLLTGKVADLADLSPNDRRRSLPKFSDGNFHKNLELVNKLKDLAEKMGITASQLALAWLHAQGDDIFPIPGTKHVRYLESNVAAFYVKLSDEEIKLLSNIFRSDASPGARAGPAQQKMQYESHLAES